MSSKEELLAEVYKTPFSDVPRLVYADFLQANGDSLGDFIALQIARSASKKKTKGKEQALLDAAPNNWWPDHPACRSGNPRWEKTERGFPTAASLGSVYRENDLAAEEQWVVSTTGKPAWATVRELELGGYSDHKVSAEARARFLRESPLVSLQKLSMVDVPLLQLVVDWSPPVVWLDVCVDRPMPVVKGFPELKSLSVGLRDDLRTWTKALQAIQESTLLERMESLEVSSIGELTLVQGLAAYVSLPDNIQRFRWTHYVGFMGILTGPHKQPHLKLALNSYEVDAAARGLEQLNADSVTGVDVEFMEGGNFDRRYRSGQLNQIREATKKWGTNARVPDR